MGDWPLNPDAQRVATLGAVAGSSTGAAVDTGALNNTKGLWTELSASTPFSIAGVQLDIRPTGSGSAKYLVDLGVGATLSEVVIVPDLFIDLADRWAVGLWLPITIPAGARLAVRAQADAQQDLEVIAHVFGGGFQAVPPLSVMTAYGIVAASSRGTAIDPGGTAHTKSAWVEIAASTGRMTRWLMALFGVQNNAAPTLGTWLVDIGVGAAGSEIVLVPDLLMGTGNNRGPRTTYGAFPVHVPSGSRLAVRAQSSLTDATDRLFDIALYGLD